MEIRAIADQYGIEFFKSDSLGRWRKFETIGNFTVGMQVVRMLRKLKLKVDVRIEEEE